jgi:hypothetical protein
MKLRFGLALSMALALACVMLVPTAGAATPRRLGGIMIPSNPERALAVRYADEDSLNWSGYAVVPGSSKVTAVASTQVVPAVNGTTPGLASTWTGIGGHGSSDLIQAGVAEEFIPGLGPNYFAWYELLPDAPVDLSNCSGDASCTVRPGDTVTVTIQATGAIQSNQTWDISVVNAGHWTYSKSVTYKSTYSSAEWILEAPSLVVPVIMPMMGNTKFDPNNTYTLNGGTARKIGDGNPISISMNLYEGIPSALDADGDGFNACAYKLSCPAPSS